MDLGASMGSYECGFMDRCTKPPNGNADDSVAKSGVDEFRVPLRIHVLANNCKHYARRRAQALRDCLHMSSCHVSRQIAYCACVV